VGESDRVLTVDDEEAERPGGVAFARIASPRSHAQLLAKRGHVFCVDLVAPGEDLHLVVRTKAPQGVSRQRHEHRAETAQLGSQRLDVTERDARAVRQQRPEAGAELLVAVERKRAQRETVEGVSRVEDARAPSRRSRELHRPLDGLGARVGGDHGRDTRRGPGDESLGKGSRQQAHAELGEVGGARVHEVAQRGDHVGVIAADREGPVPAQQVEITLSLGVDQVHALAVRPLAVEPERSHDPAQLGVQEAVVEIHRVAASQRDQFPYGCDFGGHTHSLRGRLKLTW